MKFSVTCLLCVLSWSALADVAAFSTDSQRLDIPLLVIDGGAVYSDVALILDQDTGQYTIVAAQKAGLEDIGTQQVSFTINAPGELFTRDTLTLLDIQDSRCPTGVQCIVAGQVIAGIQLYNSTTDNITLMDLALEGNGDVPGDEIDTENYIFRLLAVSPYP